MEKQISLNISIKEEQSGGFSVVCPDLEVASQGETIDEALKNIKEAIELYIESAEELGIKDEILDKIGMTKNNTLKVFRTEIPIKLTM